MGEVKTAYKTKTVKYSGLFNVNKVHKFLVSWFGNNKFNMFEEMTEEQVYPEGKQIVYSYKPYKKFSDFAKAVIHLEVIFSGVQDVKVDVEGLKKTMQKGDVEISITGYIETDYENKWETKPLFYFFKIIFEKFFLGSHRSYYESFISKNCQLLYDETKAILNISRLKI